MAWLSNVWLLSTFVIAVGGNSSFQLKKGQLSLSQELSQQFRAQQTDFKILEAKNFSVEVQNLTQGSPMAISGDFNGDKVQDLSVFGYSEKAKKFLIYAAISRGKGKYDLQLVDEFPFGENQQIQNIARYINLGDSKKIPMAKRDTVQIETFDQVSMTVFPYYYSKKQKSFLPFRGKMD